jgi:hypothetical protein
MCFAIVDFFVLLCTTSSRHPCNLHQLGNGNIHQAFLTKGASKYLDLF